MEKKLEYHIDKKSRCILLVDDDTIFNAISKRYFKHAGFNKNIKTALNGRVAISYIKQALQNLGHPDFPLPQLILLDINMPEMNGWKFLEAFSTLDKHATQGIKIVIQSSSTDKAEIERAMDFECVSDYLVKPISLNAIKYLVKRHIS